MKDIYPKAPVVNRLLNAMLEKPHPHAILFTGPRGRKRDILFRFLAFYYCQTRSACGHCPDCRYLANRHHPDLWVVSSDKSLIPLSAIRPDPVTGEGGEATKLVYRPPTRGLKRTVLILEADKMQKVAQNALLKTLEEPPPSGFFILLTSRPSLLADTIRSRCMEIALPPAVESDSLASRLSAPHGVSPDDPRLQAIIRLSQQSWDSFLKGGPGSATIEQVDTLLEELKKLAPKEADRRLLVQWLLDAYLLELPLQPLSAERKAQIAESLSESKQMVSRNLNLFFCMQAALRPLKNLPQNLSPPSSTPL